MRELTCGSNRKIKCWEGQRAIYIELFVFKLINDGVGEQGRRWGCFPSLRPRYIFL